MFQQIIAAIYVFLPAYLANSAPVIFDKFGLLKSLKKPIDGGVKIGKDYLFGETKTWRGLVAGVMVGAITGGIIWAITSLYMSYLGGVSQLISAVGYGLYYGAVLGFGIIMGDLIKSFIKRRLHIKSTDPFFPFDQMDYLGALILGYFLFPFFQPYFWILLIISPLFPILANLIAYKLGWKKVWW